MISTYFMVQLILGAGFLCFFLGSYSCLKTSEKYRLDNAARQERMVCKISFLGLVTLPLWPITVPMLILAIISYAVYGFIKASLHVWQEDIKKFLGD